MKIPKKAPLFLSLLNKMDPNRKEEFFGSLPIPHSKKYYHWDDLRHHIPPYDLTHEEWWIKINFSRSDRRRSIPLLDESGSEFTHWQTDQMSEALHQIDLKAGGNIGTSETISREDTKNYYYLNSLMQEAITSSQLEGSITTREVARDMIRSSRSPLNKSERMIVNNYHTMQQLSEWKNLPLTPSLVFEIHKLITEGTLEKEDAAGRFRNADENVAIYDDRDQEILHNPPPAEELEERLQKLCDFANDLDEQSFIHPVVKAIIIHFWLAYDHPFVDGNGRTARALFYWYIMRKNYWLFEYLSISEILVKAPIKYARSYLLTETDHNDLNYFIHYQLEVIARSIKELHRYIDKKSTEFAKTSQALQQLKTHFNHRQETLLTKALKKKHANYTVKSHQNSHRISYATARSDLRELEQHGFLASIKKGKTYVYYPTENLQEQLRNQSLGP